MAQIQNLRRLRINQSMTRPILLMGCDRILLISSIFLCIYFGFNFGLAQGRIGVTMITVMAWILISFGLRQMAKADAEMREVFIRSTQYTFRYLSCGSPNARESSGTQRAWLDTI